MAAIDSQTLLEEAKCYLCLGVSIAEALKLALLSRIASGGAGGGGGYTLTFLGGWESGALNDGAIYYTGADNYNSTRSGVNVFSNVSARVPVAGNIVSVWFKARITVAGTAETVQHFVRINDTTDVAQIDATYNANTVAGLNDTVIQPVVAGDMIAFKTQCPTWVTNPQGVRWYAVLYIDSP
jgi:hypothetical protein